MKYCCHVWSGAPKYNLKLLDKLQKLICRTVGPSFIPFFEPLAHIARLWNFLPSECFPLTYDLKGH